MDVNLEWINKLVNDIDRMEGEKFASYFHEDGVFKFGVFPESKGRKDIADGVNLFFASINALSHKLVTYVAKDNYIIWEGVVTYTRKDMSTVQIDFCNFLHMRDGLIERFNVYIDMTKLYQQ